MMKRKEKHDEIPRKGKNSENSMMEPDCRLLRLPTVEKV